MGVGVELGGALGRFGGADPVDEGLRMAAPQLGLIGRGGAPAVERGKVGGIEGGGDGAQAVHPFGVAGRGEVAQTGGIGKERGGHARQARGFGAPSQAGLPMRLYNPAPTG